MRRKGWILSVSVLGACACAWLLFSSTAVGPVVHVERGTVHRQRVAEAVVVPRAGIADVRAEVGGRVQRVLVQEGDRVSANAVLATLDAGVRSRTAEARKAQRSALEWAARSAEVTADNAEREAAARVEVSERRLSAVRARYERQKLLESAGVASSQSTDDLDAEIAVLEATVAVARTELRAARNLQRQGTVRAAHARAKAGVAEHERAEMLVERSHVRTPIAGVVVARHIDAGDTVRLERADVLFEIADPGSVDVLIELDEEVASEVRVGQRVSFLPRGGEGRTVCGTVVRASPRLRPRTIDGGEPPLRNQALVRQVWAEPDGSEDSFLLIGQRLEATVLVGLADDGLRVPRSAVVVSDGRPSVRVPWGPWTQRFDVTLGEQDGENVQVAGIEEGTSVALRTNQKAVRAAAGLQKRNCNQRVLDFP